MFPSNIDLGNGLKIKRNRAQTAILCNGIVVIVVPSAKRKGIRKMPAFNTLDATVQGFAQRLADQERI